MIPLQHNLIAECNIDDDCVGDSDTCVSNFFCQCGPNKKCSGNADTALPVNVDVETMMNAPDLTFVYLVNAEVGTLKSLKRIKL